VICIYYQVNITSNLANSLQIFFLKKSTDEETMTNFTIDVDHITPFMQKQQLKNYIYAAYHFICLFEKVFRGHDTSNDSPVCDYHTFGISSCSTGIHDCTNIILLLLGMFVVLFSLFKQSTLTRHDIHNELIVLRYQLRVVIRNQTNH
jgi:hypothetical protein